MGVIGRMLGIGGAVEAVGRSAAGVAEVFTPNATKRMEAAARAYEAALAEAGAEFTGAGAGRFDRFVNALNRLPRPMLALGTLGLFVYAMADPAGFSVRMAGLSAVPEPLWWLLGAVVSFYFGAREAHYLRVGRGAGAAEGAAVVTRRGAVAAAEGPEAAALAAENAALEDWEKRRRR